MEPWTIKIDDRRNENSKKVFIIFCEDGAVEPAYFELFKRSDVHVSTFGDTKKHHDQVDYATEYFRKHDLLEVNESGYEVLKIDDGAQIWCVFDRDKEPNDLKDTSFNDSIKAANSKGIKTAWSNDDFELWILLHFEDVDPNDPSFNHRKKYYERLTAILKEGMPNEPLFQNPMFDYYSTMKSKNRFIRYTYQLMKENIDIAINRATALDKFHFSNPPKPIHLQCPCTKVYLLIEELKK